MYRSVIIPLLGRLPFMYLNILDIDLVVEVV